MWGSLRRSATARRLPPVLLLTGVIAVVGFAGVALALTNSVHVSVPSDARQNVGYSITLKGESVNPARLYLFVDYHKCGATPAIEHQRANGDIWNLSGGKFKRVSRHWHSGLIAVDHACVYLQKPSAPVNGSSGILAADFAGYQIHR